MTCRFSRFLDTLTAFRPVPMVMCALAFSGCATGPCDPRLDHSMLVGLGCISTGGTDEFLASMRAEYARLVEEKRLTDIERRSMELQARTAARDSAAYVAQIDKERANLAALRSELEAARLASDAEKSRQAFLLNELNSLQAELERERARETASREEILRLREDVAKREAVLRDMSRPITVD